MGGKSCTSDKSLGRAWEAIAGHVQRPQLHVGLRKSLCPQGGRSAVGPARMGSAVVAGLASSHCCTALVQVQVDHCGIVGKG